MSATRSSPAAPGPYDIERKWGVFDPAFDPTNEKTYKFLDQFFGEMAKLFPDHFFHVGGDEVNGKQWDANPKIQEFMKAHDLKNNEGLQSYFNKRLEPIVSKHGKSMVGWDEVLDPTLPKDIVIQSWRGPDALAAAAKQGFRGILSNGYYLDLGWSAARHYAVDPLSGAAANLTPEEKARILGGESCMWAEYINPENIDSRIWPRNAAIAERLWSPQEITDLASMHSRMEALANRLEWLGLTHKSYHRQMLQRIAGPSTPEEFAALSTLASVVEPVKDYTREETAASEPTSAHAAEPRCRRRPARKRHRPPLRAIRRQIPRRLVPRCACRSASPRTTHRLARQRRQASAAGGAIVPGKGSISQFARPREAGRNWSCRFGSHCQSPASLR